LALLALLLFSPVAVTLLLATFGGDFLKNPSMVFVIVAGCSGGDVGVLVLLCLDLAFFGCVSVVAGGGGAFGFSLMR